MMIFIPDPRYPNAPFPLDAHGPSAKVPAGNKAIEDPDGTRSAFTNLSFQYMYCDASNYKQHGEAVFTNQTFMSMERIEKQIRACLHDGEFFIARQVHIEERFFDTLYEDDHPWHEYKCVETTTRPVFDPENWNEHHHKRDIAEFIADLEKAKRTDWGETQVRRDVGRLLERQKQELKRSFEAGKDVYREPLDSCGKSAILKISNTDWRKP